MRSTLALSRDGKPIKLSDDKTPAECTHCKMPSTALLIVNLYHGCEWQLCSACAKQVKEALAEGLETISYPEGSECPVCDEIIRDGACTSCSWKRDWRPQCP